ncbi:hypothetical protein [Spirosoma sp.]|uniref:hypothetical protein n=1 Tax=Spirosoma sp. TaxID=1899569 RepID=UPI002638721C|nr:hypothetical protein [Spirosoma sp.]MCX6216562.1 hypothetical protein [Spirosoma sp.]
MLKKLTLSVPKYLKKFIEGEFDGENGVVHIEKWNEIGRMIHLASRSIPFVITPEKPTGTTLVITYYCREKAYEVPLEKYPDFVRQLDEIFRRTLISEVRSVHYLAGGDYSTYIRNFLARYDIQPDIELEWETVRKIYRDYLLRVDKKNKKKFSLKSPA